MRVIFCKSGRKLLYHFYMIYVGKNSFKPVSFIDDNGQMPNNMPTLTSKLFWDDKFCIKKWQVLFPCLIRFITFYRPMSLLYKRLYLTLKIIYNIYLIEVSNINESKNFLSDFKFFDITYHTTKSNIVFFHAERTIFNGKKTKAFVRDNRKLNCISY